MAKPYGDVIRRLREQRAWSQQQLADKSKVGRETVLRAEQSGNVGVLLLYRLAHAFDADVSVFFGNGPRASNEKPPSVWSRLKKEQRAELVRYAYRLLGEREPPEEFG